VPRVGHNGEVLIYDGDCGFCTQCANWLRAQLATPLTVVPWQEIHDLSELGLTVADVSTAVYWVDAYGRTSRGHTAIARSLTRSKGALSVIGWLLLLPPLSWLAGPAYRLVAKNRMRLPGATAACAMPARASFTPAEPAR